MIPGARYNVVHETRYGYGEPVRLSRQVCHLQPRRLPWQRCEDFRLAISPEPDSLSEGVDAFGNPVATACIDASHDALSIYASYRAEVADRPLPDDAATLPWEEVRERLAYRAGRIPSAADLEATRFRFESPRVRNKREIAAWALDSFPARRPILAGVRALAARIHEDFTFDEAATTVTTPVTEVFESRRGVCQDFAHFMLSCLRSLGLSARYVSGYLLTHPPPGGRRLLGADASHAWVSVYCPDHGWIDADPTNAVLAGREHVTVGWGRDYRDVAPVRGVILGGGTHTVEISVTVAPEEEYKLLLGAPPSGASSQRPGA